ncbi:cytochrome b [Thioclava sp. BHET1]|nr:cytochrome b [Thioclava sp. BHET1]
MWRNTTERFGLTSITLHWIIGLLFLFQILLGYVAGDLVKDRALHNELFTLHKSLGLLVLALAAVRLVWWALTPKPGPVRGTTRLEALAASLVKWGLMAATVIVPLLGWAMVSRRGGVSIYGLFEMPALPIPANRALHEVLENGHIYLAYLAGAVACLHILAAFRHHLVKRDPTLLRMMGRG